MSSFLHSLAIVCVVLVAHNFTELDSGRADYGYLAFGELSRFVFCLLQKVKRSSDLPVTEKWGGVYAPESFVLWGNRRGAIFGKDPSAMLL